jgi:hypothetical protein
MLMITIETEGADVVLRLDGRLAGPEARELANSWNAGRFRQSHQRVTLDLTGVTSVDMAGSEFLVEVCRRGDRLIGGATTRTILAAVMSALPPPALQRRNQAPFRTAGRESCTQSRNLEIRALSEWV